MTSSDFDTLLDQCMARLQTGESIDHILRDFPEQAARLRPLLEVAARMYTLPAPRARPTAYTSARQRMLEAVDTQANAARPTVWQRFLETPLPNFTFLRQTFGNITNLVLLAILMAGLAWLFSSLDLDPDPAGEQTPTITLTPSASPTPLENIPAVPSATPTETASLIPTATRTLTVSPTLSATATLMPSVSPQPVFITLTPTPTKRDEEEDPTNTPIPTETLTPTATETPLPPYPPPLTETPSPTPTETSTTSPEVELTPTSTP